MEPELEGLVGAANDYAALVARSGCYPEVLAAGRAGVEREAAAFAVRLLEQEGFWSGTDIERLVSLGRELDRWRKVMEAK